MCLCFCFDGWLWGKVIFSDNISKSLVNTLLLEVKALCSRCWRRQAAPLFCHPWLIHLTSYHLFSFRILLFLGNQGSCHSELCHERRQMMTSHRVPQPTYSDCGVPKVPDVTGLLSPLSVTSWTAWSLSFIGNKGWRCNQLTGNRFTYKNLFNLQRLQHCRAAYLYCCSTLSFIGEPTCKHTHMSCVFESSLTSLYVCLIHLFLGWSGQRQQPTSICISESSKNDNFDAGTLLQWHVIDMTEK